MWKAPGKTAFLLAQTVKNPPAMWETWVQSLGWEDPLEEGMATQSSILAWRIPQTEEPGGLQSLGSQRYFPGKMPSHASSRWPPRLYIVAGNDYHYSTDKQLWGREITEHTQSYKAGE